LQIHGISRVPQHLNGWPAHALEVVEKMRQHPNGLMVFCHRGYSTEAGTMFRVLNVMQEESKGGTRFGCVTESLDTLPLQDGIVSVCVTAARKSWEQALRSLIAQDIDVCAMAGRDDGETTAQAVLMALEDRSVLVNISLPTVTGALLWLSSELRIDSARVAQVLLGVVGTHTRFKQVCSHCRQPYQPDESSLAVIKSQGIEVLPDDIWMRGRGCEKCNGIGFTPSRRHISEAIYIDRELAELCASRPQREELVSALAERGFSTYFEQMMDYARQGDATLEEVIRVGLARRADL
jgi:type II secretory ATPase GspE/PulE/Tfp pilus assembly ATPase PilB-like protein